MAEVTGEKIDTDHMFEALNDGVILIKLVNTIKPGTIPKWNDTSNSKALALAATGNIRLYLCAVEKFGVPGVDMFLVEDLRTGRSMSMVCRNLASLSRIAARDLGWQGPTLGPRLAAPGPKKWQDVEYNPYQHVDDVPQSELEEQLVMYKGLLEKEHEELVKAMSSESTLRHEVDALKAQIKQYKRDYAALMDELEHDEAKIEKLRKSRSTKAFENPGLPEHLQPVEKSDKEDIEQKAARRARKLASQSDMERQSSQTIAEWQKKASKVQKKMKLKQERGLALTDQVESPNTSLIEESGPLDEHDEDRDVLVDLLPDHDFSGSRRRRRGTAAQSPGGTPSKYRRDENDRTHSVSRKGLILIIVLESLLCAGLAGATAYFAFRPI